VNPTSEDQENASQESDATQLLLLLTKEVDCFSKTNEPNNTSQKEDLNVMEVRKKNEVTQ
jgi:hypothetical protein